MATLPDPITVEQFRQLPKGGEFAYELHDGKVVAVTRPKPRHWKLQRRLARLLDPKDFGLYAAGTVITGITSLFAESGMLAALITRKDRIDEAASTAFVSLALTGIVLTCASLAVSPLLGLAVHSGEVAMITAVLSGWLFVRALTIVPDARSRSRGSSANVIATGEK